MRWLFLFGVWLVYFCFGVTIASMAPLVTPISEDLGIGNAMMGAILGAWPLLYIAAAVPCGVLLDRVGAGAGLVLAALIMSASAFARSFAVEPWQLMAAVGLFGIGGPLISIGAPKLIALLFEGRARGTAMGIYMTGPYLGGILALSLTNSVVLPAVGDWRGAMAAYGVMVLLGGLVWLAILALPRARPIREAAGAGRKFDLAAFLEIARAREVQLILVMAIGVFFINHGFNNWLPELLMERGLSPTEAGYLASIPSLIGIIGVLIIPRLATPEWRIRVMGLLFLSTALASLLLHAAPGTVLLTGLVLQGVARSSMMTVAILLLMEARSVPSDRIGVAGGLFFTIAEIGGVFGPLAIGIAADISGGFTVPLFLMTGVAAFLFATLIALAGVQRRITAAD